MKILIKYATRSRRSNFLRGFDSIRYNLADKENCHVLITVDDDDEKIHPLPVLHGVNYSYVTGTSESKIHAINRGMDQVPENFKDWDILVNFSDDQVFVIKGFDDIIRSAFMELGGEDSGGNLYGETNLDKCVHFPDQHQGQNCMTMTIVGRDYYNRDKFIYDTRFESLWCDVVAQEVAQIRGCYEYVDTVIFNHLHPSFGDCPYDAQYLKTEDVAVRRRDYETYLKLKSEYDPTTIFPIRSL